MKNILICHVSGFHPPDIGIQLMRGNEELKGANQTDLAFKEDWHFHLTKSADFTPQQNEAYFCKVTHGSKVTKYNWGELRQGQTNTLCHSRDANKPVIYCCFIQGLSNSPSSLLQNQTCKSQPHLHDQQDHQNLNLPLNLNDCTDGETVLFVITFLFLNLQQLFTLNTMASSSSGFF